MVKILHSLKDTALEAARILFLIALTVLKSGIRLATTSFFQINVKQSNYALDGHNQQHKKIGGDELTVPQLDLLLAPTLGIWLATASCLPRNVKSPIMPNRTIDRHN